MTYDPANVSPPLGVTTLPDADYATFDAWFYAQTGLDFSVWWDTVEETVYMGGSLSAMSLPAPNTMPGDMPAAAQSAWSTVWGWFKFAASVIAAGTPPIVVPPNPIVPQ